MRRTPAYLLVLLAFAVTSVAGAEVLVTTDGSEIEIRGPWQQKGKMVIFTLASGQLSTLRAEDVDFDATQRRNASTAAPAPEPAAPKARAKIVITDADVAHVAPVPPAVESEETPADGAAAGEAAEPAEASTSAVRVIAWDQDDPDDGEGRVIFGTLRNDGNFFATGISLEISIYENEGVLAGSQSVAPVKTALRPGESTTFRVQFRDVYAVAAARMVVSSVDLDVDRSDERPSLELDS